MTIHMHMGEQQVKRYILPLLSAAKFVYNRPMYKTLFQFAMTFAFYIFNNHKQVVFISLCMDQ